MLDAPEGAEPRLAEIASAAGLPERLAHVRGALSPADRAAVLAGAAGFAATSPIAAWPWRAVEAMALGIPVIAVPFGYTDLPVEAFGPDRVIGHFDELVEAVAALVPAARG